LKNEWILAGTTIIGILVATESLVIGISLVILSVVAGIFDPDFTSSSADSGSLKSLILLIFAPFLYPLKKIRDLGNEDDLWDESDT